MFQCEEFTDVFGYDMLMLRQVFMELKQSLFKSHGTSGARCFDHLNSLYRSMNHATDLMSTLTEKYLTCSEMLERNSLKWRFVSFLVTTTPVLFHLAEYSCTLSDIRGFREKESLRKARDTLRELMMSGHRLTYTD